MIFLCLFFLFNTLEIDSNDDKVLIYNKNELYEENDYNIYFKNITNKKIKDILKILNIEVLSYYIDGEKYYTNSINELIIVATTCLTQGSKKYTKRKIIYIPKNILFPELLFCTRVSYYSSLS